MLAKDGTAAKLDALLKELGPVARRGTFAEAAAFGEVVLFSVYWPRFEFMLDQVGAALDGKVVIDTMNPLKVNERFEHSHDTELMARSSTSEELQRRLPKARVVKAFSTLPSQVLDASQWSQNPVAPSIFVAGDEQPAKEIVFQLVRDAGFEHFDVGPLVGARSIEQLGVLLHLVGTHQFKGEYARLAPTFLLSVKAAEVLTKRPECL